MHDAARVSDAGPELLAESARRFEPPLEWREDEKLIVDTGAPDWRQALGDNLSRALESLCQSKLELQGDERA
jgi:hypothetical protein